MKYLLTALVFFGMGLSIRTTSTGRDEAQDTQGIEQGTEATFDDLLDAIEWVESRGIASKVCPDGCCVGAYQITQIYLDDYYRIKGWPDDRRYSDDIRRDKLFSRIITETVTKHYANATWPDLDVNDPQFIETAARTHKSPRNRTISKTDAYWNLIQARMEGVK